MWNYKLTCLFGGWGRVIVLASLVVMQLVIWLVSDSEYALWILVSLPCIPALGLLIAFIVTHILTQEDRRQIAEALPPEWRPLLPNSQVVTALLEQCRTDRTVISILGGFLILCGLICLIPAPAVPEARIAAVALAAIGGLSIAFIFARLSFWQQRASELELAVISVAYCRRIPKLNHRIPGRLWMAVFYLPEGKHRLSVLSYQPPKELYFIRYHGMVRRVRWGRYGTLKD